MKTSNIFRATLALTAALAMVSCSKEIDNIEEITTEPETPAFKVIPYTVTVGDASASRATVDEDNKTLRFADGDKLHVVGTVAQEDILGILDITSGVGETSATFSGTLFYRGEGTPPDGLSLTAKLVSQNQVNKYPEDEYLESVVKAVPLYSVLTGTSTYGAKSFTLIQQTAFLNFVITFEDGTTEGTVKATVSNDGAQLCSANVYVEKEGDDFVAKFVLPVAAGTVLKGATVKLKDNAAIPFGDGKTLEGKVYNVKKTYGPASYTWFSLADSKPGMIVATNGRAYVPGYFPEGLTRAGMVAYKQGNNGRVIALADDGQMGWDAAWNGAANHTPKVQIFGKDEEYYSWRLPYSDLDWEIMIGAFSGFEGLNNALTAAGGSESTLKSGAWYWTASTIEEDEMECGLGFQIFGTYGPVTSYKSDPNFVRACFDF